jgi:DNA repair exonuclease SbcCD ATPase subunit
MTKTTAALALTAALGLAACDNSEYETRIADLETELETARGQASDLEARIAEAQSQAAEAEQIRVQLEEAQARVAELESEPNMSAPQVGADPTVVEGPLLDVVERLRRADDRLAELGDQLAEAGQDVDTDDVRDELAEAVRALDDVAQEVGVALRPAD